MQPSASQGFRPSLNLDVNKKACYIYRAREHVVGIGVVALFGHSPLHESRILAVLDSEITRQPQDSLGILVGFASYLNARVQGILALCKIYTGLRERLLGCFRRWTLMRRFPCNRHIEMLVG